MASVSLSTKMLWMLVMLYPVSPHPRLIFIARLTPLAFRKYHYGAGRFAIDLTPSDGTEFMGERLTVQFARGSRARNEFAAADRTAPRPRRTPHRMQISGLPGETSWQVCYSCSFIRMFWISRIAIWILSGFMFGTIWDKSKRPRVYCGRIPG